MIEVPQAEILIDATLYAQRQTHDRVMKTWREEIEAMHRERCLITLTLHPRSDYGSARASRIAALDRMLTWLRDLADVSFMTCEQIADGARWRRSSRHGAQYRRIGSGGPLHRDTHYRRSPVFLSEGRLTRSGPRVSDRARRR